MYLAGALAVGAGQHELVRQAGGLQLLERLDEPHVVLGRVLDARDVQDVAALQVERRGDAGLRVGLAMTSPALAAQLAKVKDSYNLDRLAQAGALAALEDQATMRANVAKVRATRARLEGELGSMGFRVVPSQANFVLAYGKGGSLEGLARALKERGVLVRWFAGLPDALRISVGTDAQVDRFLAELRPLAG